MISQEKYFDFGVKYGIPLAIIGATIAMKRVKGIGKLAVFALTTPAILGLMYSLKKTKDENQF